MYAILKNNNILGKYADRLETVIINYNLGSNTPIAGYSLFSDNNLIISGNINISKEIFLSWTNNDEIILQNVADQLGLEILEIKGLNEKTSEEYLIENSNLEIK